MANTIAAQFDLTGSVTVNNADVAISPVASTNKIGGNGFAAIQSLFNTNTPTTPLPTNAYCSQQTIAAAGNFDIDFNGGTMYDTLNVAMAWTKLHFLLVAVVSPDGAKYVKVGAQNVTNGLDIGCGGVVTATAYREVYNFCTFEKPSVAGYTVDATHKVVRINNPTGSSVTAEHHRHRQAVRS